MATVGQPEIEWDPEGRRVRFSVAIVHPRTDASAWFVDEFSVSQDGKELWSAVGAPRQVEPSTKDDVTVTVRSPLALPDDRWKSPTVTATTTPCAPTGGSSSVPLAPKPEKGPK